ncbi:MAG TPA: twin-arginine translocase subunit TatC [Solirubrobacterales bacterium]|nr:twin-arginine translocase subunit TatC [Solirubrobacterales bacterium]
MARINRPIGYEDRLSLVQHLDELRGRVIICVVALVGAFALCFWQADTLLDVVNRPLEEAQRDASAGDGPDPIRQAAEFDRGLAAAIEQTVPGLESLGRALEQLAGSERLSRADRLALAAPAAELEAAAEALQAAAAEAPPDQTRRPVTLGVAEPFMTTMTVAGYAAILLILPLILYQAYAYMLPALRPAERRAAMPLLLAAPGLFLAGVVFAYFVVLPGAVGFLQNFNSENFDILVQARAYYGFSVMMMAGLGLLFQVPLAVLALTRLGIVTPAQLRANRPYYILGVAILAAIGNGSPDPFTMIMIMIPLILLFEFSVRLAGWLEARDGAATA